MSPEAQNVAALKDTYARWAACKGTDHACWVDLLADEASLASLADGAEALPFTAPRQSKADIMRYLEGLTRDWEMVEYDMRDYVAQGDRVVAIGRIAWRNKATGKVAASPKVDVWRFRDGKAVEVAEFYDTAAAYAAASP